MYEKLTSHYDSLFPLQKDLARVILKSDTPSSLLDVGCGTGLLLQFLKDHAWKVEGLEYTAPMVELCQSRGLSVTQGGFDSLSSLTGTWDHISCVGNTLPHGASEEEIESFIKNGFAKLNWGGQLHLQWINFEKLKKEHPQGFHFPDLVSGDICFKREYHWNGDNSVDFHCTLREGHSEWEEYTKLLYLRKSFIERTLIKAGFSSTAWDVGATAFLVHGRKD